MPDIIYKIKSSLLKGCSLVFLLENLLKILITNQNNYSCVIYIQPNIISCISLVQKLLFFSFSKNLPSSASTTSLSFVIIVNLGQPISLQVVQTQHLGASGHLCKTSHMVCITLTLTLTSVYYTYFRTEFHFHSWRVSLWRLSLFWCSITKKVHSENLTNRLF